ncbi:MAG: arginine--tRNA ligase [Planctomycetia bacterium]|nr:arginine--tRNA ligase [Planctomycetia bacterium]
MAASGPADDTGPPSGASPGADGTLRDQLRAAFAGALSGAAADGVFPVATAADMPALLDQVRETADPKFGDFSGTMAMGLAKAAGRKPRDVAVDVAKRLAATPGFDTTFAPPGDPVGPGFINVRVRDEALATAVSAAFVDDRLGVPRVARPETIVIDFSSPNVAKPMHVGHIRSTVIGDALTRILRFRGHRVITDNHLGDWGTQFGMILWGWKHCRDDAAFAADPTAELGRLYRSVRKIADAKPEDLAADPAAAALAARHPGAAEEVLQETARLHAGDEENRRLWQSFMPACLADIERLYRRLDVSFDHWLGESFFQPFLADVVTDLERRGLARESRGAVGVFVDGDDKPPFLVRKADGAFLYATTDLATIRWRLEHWHPDRILYVVDHRQGQHFEQLFKTAHRWGIPGLDRVALVHVAFGTVLGEDGKPFKTRSGDTVGLESLLDEGVERAAAVVAADEGLSDGERRLVAETIGIGAIKYADLCQNRTTDYVFSYDKMLELKGNTAAYMQYAVARVEGVFEKGGIDRMALRRSAPAIVPADPKERALALAILRFGDVLADVEADYRPNLLTTWLYDLAGRYSAFYDSLPILKCPEPERTSRLALADLTGRVLRKGLELLGIGTVRRM